MLLANLNRLSVIAIRLDERGDVTHHSSAVNRGLCAKADTLHGLALPCYPLPILEPASKSAEGQGACIPAERLKRSTPRLVSYDDHAQGVLQWDSAGLRVASRPLAIGSTS